MAAVGFDLDLLKQRYLWLRMLTALSAVLILFLLYSFKACAHINFICTNDNRTRISMEHDICLRYPFRLTDELVEDSCAKTRVFVDVFHLNFAPFVYAFTAVVWLSLLYTLATLVGFLGWWSVYHGNHKYAFWDLLLTSAVGSYLLAGAASYSSVLGNLKSYASDDQLAANVLQIPSCTDPSVGSCSIGRDDWGHWGSLNFVLLLTYLAIALWAVNSFWILQKLRYIRAQPRLTDARDDGDEDTVYDDADKYGEYRRLI